MAFLSKSLDVDVGSVHRAHQLYTTIFVMQILTKVLRLRRHKYSSPLKGFFMRNTRLSAAVIATLALTSTTAFAQTTTTQTEVETTGTSTTTTTVTQTTPRILSIALPPNVRLRMDINARDEDLLGVV